MKPPQPAWARPPLPPATNGNAVTSLILSIVLPGPGSLMAIVFGRKARREIRLSGERGDALAVAGIVIGWVGLSIAAIGVVLVFLIAQDCHEHPGCISSSNPAWNKTQQYTSSTSIVDLLGRTN